MRSPLQGGLPPAGAASGMREIACDESGFSGTNLRDETTPVITHASVDLTLDEAAGLVGELRARFRPSPHELKSGQFLRRPGEALDFFLAALPGRAAVQLVDKEFFLVTRVVDLLIAEPSYAAGTRLTADQRPPALDLFQAGCLLGARRLHRDGCLHRDSCLHRGGCHDGAAGRKREPSPALWDHFLDAFIDLVRTKRRRPSTRPVEVFRYARDALARQAPAPAAAVLAAITPARVRDLSARLDAGDRTIPPPLEPLLPALAETVLTWSSDGGRQRGFKQVLVIHDEQSALTADRLIRLGQALTVAGSGGSVSGSGESVTAVGGSVPVVAGAAPPGVSPLAGLVMADSRDDPRVQIADLLAGVARRMPALLAPALLAPALLAPALPAPPGTSASGCLPSPDTPGRRR